jgi:hypothetical protein
VNFARIIIAVIVLALGLSARATPVGVKKKAAPVSKAGRLAAPATAVGLDVTAELISVSSDGSARIGLRYVNGVGVQVVTRQIIVPADRTKPVVDSNGVVLSATVPTALGNALDAFKSQVHTMVDNAASTGKLDL